VEGCGLVWRRRGGLSGAISARKRTDLPEQSTGQAGFRGFENQGQAEDPGRTEGGGDKAACGGGRDRANVSTVPWLVLWCVEWRDEGDYRRRRYRRIDHRTHVAGARH